jgi:hypothetical protein
MIRQSRLDKHKAVEPVDEVRDIKGHKVKGASEKKRLDQVKALVRLLPCSVTQTDGYQNQAKVLLAEKDRAKKRRKREASPVVTIKKKRVGFA